MLLTASTRVPAPVLRIPLLLPLPGELAMIPEIIPSTEAAPSKVLTVRITFDVEPPARLIAFWKSTVPATLGEPRVRLPPAGKNPVVP